MGCSQSKIENEEAVARCKERKRFMKEAVSTRNAFAAAHSAYATCLKNSGAALGDFAHGEVQNPQLPSSSSADTPFNMAPQQPFEIALPPPPLPDAFTPSPLQRAASMPEMIINKPDSSRPKPNPIIEEEDDELLELENEGSLRQRKSNRSNSSSRRDDNNNNNNEERRTPMPPPPPPSKQQPPLRDNNDDVTHHRSISQPPQEAAWEYFFPSMENVAGTTLHDAEEIDTKVFDEKPKRIVEDEVHSTTQSHVEVPEPEPEPGPEPKPVNVPEVMMESPAPNVKGKQTAAAGGSVDGKRIVKHSGENLLQIFAKLDDHFLKASESAHEVSKMLEATRLHYHSNFADNRGHIDHSARVMRVITWNRSIKGIPNLDDGKDDFDSNENETHATILDKLLAWEKKLYDEVKAGELMKFEYQRKVASLNKLKKRGTTNSEALEKAKAVVSHLHTRYIVDMQSLDSTVSEINRLRDEQLYPRLVQLVDGMATMWRVMLDHHEKQSDIVKSLKLLDISQSSKQTSEHHHDRTYQLLLVAQQWHSQFEMLVNNQKGYIKALNTWLKLNLTPIESNVREKVSSPPRVRSPPIQGLLHAWNDRLEKLPDEVARTAIGNFVAVVDTIVHQQEEELAMKKQCEDTRKELTRKTKQFEDWRNKYLQRKTPDEFNLDRAEDTSAPDEVVTERQFAVDLVGKRLEDEQEAYGRQCLHVRQKTLGSLKNRMPELFRVMSDYSLECSKMYSELKPIAQELGQSSA